MLPPLLDGRVQGVRVLALVAHPDDEAWALAPTLAGLVRGGALVEVVTATAGEAGVDRSPSGLRGAQLAEVRQREFARCVQHIGGVPLPTPGFADAQLSSVPQKRWEGWFDDLRGRRRPDVWMTLAEDGGYGHRDHVALTLALLRWSEHAGVCVRLWCAPASMACAMSEPLRRHAPDFLSPDAPAPGSCWALADEAMWVDDARAVIESCLAHHVTQLRHGRASSFFGGAFWRSVAQEQRWRAPGRERVVG